MRPSRRFAALRFLCLLCALLAVFALPGSPAVGEARAGEITPGEAHISIEDEEIVLSADFSINLGSRLEDALLRGIALTFKLECLIERPRDYWVSEHILTFEKSYRLSYSPLTRQYRVSIGNLHQSFGSLPEALRLLAHVSALPVGERPRLRAGTPYAAALRLSLDASQLPQPFQLDALTSSAWKVDATTLRWRFVLP